MINFPTISPYVYASMLAVWLGFYLYAKRQFDLARKITLGMALDELKKARNTIPDLSVERYYEYLLPIWEEEITSKINLIPHKSELWPMPAKPEYVRARLNFTPDWLGAYLQINKRPLSASEDLQARIDQIVALSQKIAP